MASAVNIQCTLSERGMKQYQKRLKSITGSTDPILKEYSTAKLPAHKAAYDGNIPALESIFISKASTGGLPIADKGITPLHMAIKGNKIEAIKWLLKYTTTSVWSCTKDGKTCIHTAVEQGNLECIKALLTSEEKNLKQLLCTVEDKHGLTSLLLAVQKHKNVVFKHLLNELGPKSLYVTNKSGISVAHVAASTGNFEILDMLNSKHKKMLTQKTNDAFYAAQEGQIEALSFLHETANCDIGDVVTVSKGLKLIHIATSCGHIKIIEYLVSKQGSNVIYDVTKDGSTPLHIAATVGNIEVSKWIINFDKTGQAIKAIDNNGSTPAHNAADAQRVDVLKYLIENGADVNLPNKKHETVCTLALHSNNSEIIEMFKERPASSVETAVPDTVPDTVPDIVPDIVPDPSYTDPDDSSSVQEQPDQMEREKQKEPLEEFKKDQEEDEEPIYSVPDPDTVAKKKEGPPIPPQNFTPSPLAVKKQKSLSVLEKWPHSKATVDETTIDHTNDRPRLQSSTKSVSSVWPPPVNKTESVRGAGASDLPQYVKKTWPPTSQEIEEEEVQTEAAEAMKQEVEVEKQEIEPPNEEVEELPKPFVKLRKTIKEPKKGQTDLELEGAGNELKAALLKRKQTKHH